MRHKLGTIPQDFLGLGYETSSVAVSDLLSAYNRTYVQLVRTLSPAGVIRVGETPPTTRYLLPRDKLFRRQRVRS
ncbi:MAG: hypothetical protein ACRD4O_14990 [Bryobacteraceae bacterium]